MKQLLIIALTMLFTQLQAQVRIGDAEAYLTAEKFLLEQGKENKQTLALSEEIKSTQSGQTNLFVFTMKPKGYVIVSAMDEVLAYSFESTMPAFDELPDNIAYWMELYNEQTDYLLLHPDQIKKPTKHEHSVGPLLTSVWGQGCYHNAACPKDDLGPCQHAEAGCVAVAMAQIMYYHKQPINGVGSMTYNNPPYGFLSANFGITYQWDQMADTLHGNNPAVAKLIYHCGVSVKMNYSPNSSGASNQNAVNALNQFFFYPLSTLCNRTDFSNEDWSTLITNDLDKHLPVYYSGKSNLGKHAFVCDGYDTNGLFHFNFGWDGVADGFYTIDSPYGFADLQCCIHNIIPISSIPIQSDNHGIIYVTPEGNGNGSSWENATNDLQAAIYKSFINNDTIWVKEGTYQGEPIKNYAFNLIGYCQLYGGFKGDEPYDYDLSLRDFEAHPSILDGSHTQGVINMSTEFIDGHSSLIDGFTIQNGYASLGGGMLLKCRTHIKNCKFCYNYARTHGGGIAQRATSDLGKVIIENCEFFGNEANNGGGIYDNGDSQYSHCHIHDNFARQDGGGVFISGNSDNKDSQFLHCIVNNNMAQNNGGGLLAKDNSLCTFWSCLICNNTAQDGGGVVMSGNSNLYNCTIVKNEAIEEYGGVFSSSNAKSQNTIKNCIIWGNISSDGDIQIGPSKNHYLCAVQDDDTESNFNTSVENDGGLPRFYVRFRNPNVSAGIAGQGGDWRLQSNSLCINRGTSINDQPETDLEGNPRLKHGNIDLGAYESDVATLFTDVYYCEDEPYYYQDSLFSELGYYTFLFPSQPYDHLLVIQMQNPPPTVFLYEKICENETYDFFGTLLSETGQYTTTNRCVTYSLKLTVKPWDSVMMNEEICDGETYDFFGTPLQETGHYSTVVNCKTYELDLTVNPTQLPVFKEEEICEGESYEFFGRTLCYAGHYSNTIDCTTYHLDLTVNPLPDLHCSSDTIVEYGNFVQLQAFGADSYLWSTGDTTSSITVYPVTDRTYTVQGFSKSGCSDKTLITVRVNKDGDEIVLFPNPTDNKVKIYMPLIDEVEVFDLLGVRMERIDANRQLVDLDVGYYTNGVYIVHIRCLNNHYYQKLVVRH